MPRRRSLLHVRQFVEETVRFANEVAELKDAPPILKDYAAQMRLVGRCILRKHTAKNQATNQRKDIYVERL